MPDARITLPHVSVSSHPFHPADEPPSSARTETPLTRG